jgi:hypothetical protein
VVAEVATGFLEDHASHVVTDGDALAKGAELEAAARRVGWPRSRHASGGRGADVMVGEPPGALELGGIEHVGLARDQDGDGRRTKPDCPAPR